MFTNIPIKLVNNHIITDDTQRMIVDTGSPQSFHSSGVISLCGEVLSVETSNAGVKADYLSEKVGTEINGLIGMDIINRYPLLIDLRNRVIIVDDDAIYTNAAKHVELGSIAQGLMAIEMMVNNKTARMIVDTGAPLSYISKSFVGGRESEGVLSDFHPLFGDFSTDTFRCHVTPIANEQAYDQLFGILPDMLQMVLSMLSVDGIIGIDLFKRYRIQIRNGVLYIPPQGT